ncbi:MAG: SIS domain-containing protein [Phycisphaerales bacterium]|jgi:D-sedoheptulose 7-phosphate isomerase|nr:SIS domain-containing protein [Phycisphaerales bacterium]
MEHTQMIEARLQGSTRAVQSLQQHSDVVAAMLDLMIDRLQAGGTIWTAGNGGSAAQALHLSEELVGRYRADRRPLASAMLAADPTALTCIANDFGFEQIFTRPLQALASEHDVLVVLSTSGRSANIVNALTAARAMGCATVGLLGGDGGESLPLCDHAIVVDANDSAHVQDAHQVLIHLLCEGLDAWATRPQGDQTT